MMEEDPMHQYHKLSDASDDSAYSESSDKSSELPPSFRNLNLELKRNIEELKSEFDRNHQTFTDKVKELDDATDHLEAVHRNTTVGSLVGSSIGAAGGVATIAGLCLAPFTLGASLALTVGAVAGVTGGVTGGASNITNTVKQKTLRQNIEKIINDFKATIKPMVKLMETIYNITEDIELEKTLNKLDIQRSARGAVDMLKMAGGAAVADIGITCAEAAKEIRVYVKAVKAARGSASAARAVRATAETAKSLRTTAAFAGAFSAGFLVLDVYCIVQDSKELSEMNQPAGKRKEEEISSETLKFILQTKEASDQFKKIVKKIEDTLDTYL
ncbi:uncharacterized protein LOC143736519 [Siphateles boraxobius]|uniref:uncharacterized protein LOC143736519 n=1 Tax=Siphateles boraxobius TaxID=180520 RepID=UPI004063D6E8